MAVSAIHPGEHLAEELDVLEMSAAALARKIRVPTNRVTQILNGTRSITGDTALRLAHFFGTSAQFWLNLQSLYDLRLAEDKGREIHQGAANAEEAGVRECMKARGRNGASNDERSGLNAGAIKWQGRKRDPSPASRVQDDVGAATMPFYCFFSRGSSVSRLRSFFRVTISLRANPLPVRRGASRWTNQLLRFAGTDGRFFRRRHGTR